MTDERRLDASLELLAEALCHDAQVRGYDHGPNPTLMSYPPQGPAYCPRHLGIAESVRSSLSQPVAALPQPATEPAPTWCPKHHAYDHCEDATLARQAAEYALPQPATEPALILPDDTVCACLDETGERKVRRYDQCQRCGAFMVADDDAQPSAEVERLRAALEHIADGDLTARSPREIARAALPQPATEPALEASAALDESDR